MQIEEKLQYKNLCFCKEASSIDCGSSFATKMKIEVERKVISCSSSHVRCSIEKLLKMLKTCG